jgi:hypothetical protein
MKLTRKLASYFLILLISTLPVWASVYSAGGAVTIARGQTVTVWSAETPTPGNGTTAASQQVVTNSQAGPGPGTAFSVHGKFSGAPGAFEVDVQVSDTDSDTEYQTCSNCNITTVDSTNNTFHLDAVQVNTKYVRLLMRTRTNSVSITATVMGG